MKSITSDEVRDILEFQNAAEKMAPLIRRARSGKMHPTFENLIREEFCRAVNPLLQLAATPKDDGRWPLFDTATVAVQELDERIQALGRVAGHVHEALSQGFVDVTKAKLEAQLDWLTRSIARLDEAVSQVKAAGPVK